MHEGQALAGQASNARLHVRLVGHGVSDAEGSVPESDRMIVDARIRGAYQIDFRTSKAEQTVFDYSP